MAFLPLHAAHPTSSGRSRRNPHALPLASPQEPARPESKRQSDRWDLPSALLSRISVPIGRMRKESLASGRTPGDWTQESGVRSVSSVYPTSSTLAVASLDDLQWLEIHSSVNDLMHDGILLNLNISRPFLSAIWPISDESCGPLAEIKQNTRGIGRIGIWGPKRSWHFRGTAEN